MADVERRARAFQLVMSAEHAMLTDPSRLTESLLQLLVGAIYGRPVRSRSSTSSTRPRSRSGT